MTEPTPPPIDTDDLPPTQYLILEVLAARHRLGEHLWTFPAKLRHHMDKLADLGLIGWKSGITEGTIRAWLTDTGQATALDPTYTPPADEQPTPPHVTEWLKQAVANHTPGQPDDIDRLRARATRLAAPTTEEPQP